MKFTVTKSAIQEELQLADAVIDRKVTIPILQYMRVEAEGNRVSIAATSLTEWLRTSVDADVAEPGVAVLPVTLLAKVVSEFSDGPVTFHLKGSSVTVTSGKAATKFPVMDPADFPSPPDVPAACIEIPAAGLRSLIKLIRHAVQSDGGFWCKGAKFSGDKGQLSAAATDGHRVAEASTPLTAEHQPFEALLPERALDCLVKVINAGADDVIVQGAITERSSSWRIGSRQFDAQLIEARFPNYRNAIPNETRVSVRIDSDPLRAALSRLMVVVTKEKNIVKFSISKGELVCSADTAVGAFTEPIAVDYDGPDFVICFNPKFVMDAIDAIDADAVCFTARDEMGAGILRAVDTSTHLCAISPMRN